MPPLALGVLITETASIYHRFTVDTADTITVMRLFQDEPKWTPHSRSLADTDKRQARVDYLQQLQQIKA